MLQRPFSAILEAGVTALVGINQQVDQNDYGASVEIALGVSDVTDEPVSGEILSFAFYSAEEGSGSVQTPAGKLLLLDADPAVSAGDTAITAAEHRTIPSLLRGQAQNCDLGGIACTPSPSVPRRRRARRRVFSFGCKNRDINAAPNVPLARWTFKRKVCQTM